MNWFRRSSRSPSLRRFGSSGKMSTGNDERGAALWEAFRSHWTQANEIVSQESEQLSEPTGEQITAVFRHLDQMMLLLVTEVNAQNDLSIGPVLDGLFTDNVLQRVSVWVSSCTGSNAEQCRRHLLRLYEGLLNQSQYCLLVHKPILLPMLTLLEECSRTAPQEPDVEQRFVLLLNQICVKITDKDNSPLLEFFFSPSTDEGPPKFLVFTFLIPYLYNEGNIGQLARDALLLLLSVSANVESVGQFIAEHSNFCPVLATGLSALYSALPRRMSSRADDWHRITEDDIDNIGEIRSFYNALEFCNAVVQVGHEHVLERLLDFIYNGFLVSVLGAALHENSLEELIAATAYLELFFRTSTEPQLLRILMKFILTEQYDGAVLLETLVTRISSNSRLCIVSLSLFETLLNLNSEDLLFELVLKYLIPCTHIMVSQANNLTDLDYYGKSAQRFLSLIPACCLASRTCDISSASSASSLNTSETGSTDRGPSVRQDTVQGQAVSSDVRHSSSVNSPVNGALIYEVEPEVTMKSHEMAYGEYLKDAHGAIGGCAVACSCWRFSYDGKTPDPALFREDSPPSTLMSSDANNERATTASIKSEASVPDEPSTQPDQDSIKNAKGEGERDKAASDAESTTAPVDPSGKQRSQDGSGFKRQSSFRKSKTNRYYRVPRPASAGQGSAGGIETVPELDLTLGGEDGFEEGDDDGEYEEVETSDETAGKPRASTVGVEGQESSLSSSGSTPRHNQKGNAMSTSMPPDYFKLAFDEESLYGGVSDSQEESDIGSGPGHHYVLRGWSQIQDMNTFLEVLHRVRSSRTVSKQTVEEICEYVDAAYSDIAQRSTADQALSSEREETNSMAVSKDSGVDVADGEQTNREESTKIIHITLKSSFTSPNIGPFLSVLLHKLDNMLQNSLFMNLHLTGVLARLACYPQVLITSFLLNYSLVFQPAVRSLHQVLTSLRHKVDNYACTVDNFEMLLLRGRIFLLQRERRHEMEQKRRQSRSDSVHTSSTAGGAVGRKNAVDDGSQANDASRVRPKRQDGRLHTFTQLFQSRLTGGSPSSRESGSRSTNTQTPLVHSPAHRGYHHLRKLQNNDLTLEAMKTKNVIYCAIVLEEFLKEMAAISQEHAIRGGAVLHHQQ